MVHCCYLFSCLLLDELHHDELTLKSIFIKILDWYYYFKTKFKNNVRYIFQKVCAKFILDYFTLLFSYLTSAPKIMASLFLQCQFLREFRITSSIRGLSLLHLRIWNNCIKQKKDKSQSKSGRDQLLWRHNYHPIKGTFKINSCGVYQ